MNMRYFKIYTFAILAFTLPMIIANVYYIDDIGRSTSGYTRWGIDGRPLADIVMKSLNLSDHLVDLFPLPLFIAMACLALSFLLFKRTFIGEGRLSFVVPLAFLCNPFFIEVLTYRFDVLTISIGLLCSFASFKRMHINTLINYCLQTLLFIAVFCTYQPIINIVVVLCVLEIFHKIHCKATPEHIINRSLVRLSQLIASSLIYMKVILPVTFEGSHSTSHPSISSDVISTLFTNIDSYHEFIVENYFFSYGGLITSVSYVIVILLSSILIFKYIKNQANRRNASLALVAIMALLGAILSPLLSMVSLLFLENPLTTFSRVYIGIGGYFLFLFSLLYYAINNSRFNFAILIIAAPLLYALNLSYAYGNAIREQDKIDRHLISEIKSSTSKFAYNSMYIVFNGHSMRSAVLDNTVKNFPLINVIVVDYFKNWYWPFRKMMINGYRQLYPSKNSGIVQKSLSEMCKFSISTENQDFNVLVRDDVIIIDFEKTRC